MVIKSLEAIEGQEVSAQCKVENIKDLLNTDIAHTFAQHMADASEYKPELLMDAFVQLKEGKKLSAKDAKRLIEGLQDPNNKELLSRFIQTHKDIFASLLSGLDEHNNLHKNEHPLFDADGKFVGYDRVVNYVKTNTEGLVQTESSEAVSTGASEEMKVHMKNTQEGMNNKNRLSDADREALEGLPSSMRKEAGVDIINLQGFGEFSSTTKSGTEYRDMDKDGIRSINNLKESNKFRAFADTIAGCDMMSLERTYQLMNIVAKQLGITDTIDENYLNTVFSKYSNTNLPLDNDLGRILRALYVITGDWFVIPISVRDNLVRSVVCVSNSAGIYGGSVVYDVVRPFAKIGGSQ